MRPKRGQEVSVRLNELLNSPVSVNWISESNQTFIAVWFDSNSEHVITLNLND